VGVAVSDETQTIAQPHSTISRTRGHDGIADVAKLVRDLSISRIVVGLPLQLDGGEGDAAAEARAFGAAVARATALEVTYLDERLTTKQAERHLIASGASRARRRQVGDQVAATLILQQVLAMRTPRGK
jgi:putative Holliday junction resolvase